MSAPDPYRQQAPYPQDPYRGTGPYPPGGSPGGPYGPGVPPGWPAPPGGPGAQPASPSTAPLSSGAAARRVLAAVGLGLVVLGLALPGAGVWPLAVRLPLWSLFALACAVVVVVVATQGRVSGARRYLLIAAGAGLFAFWVLIVLPGVASNIGFVLTAGTACSAVACGLHLRVP